MIEVLQDTLLDSVKLLPFLLITFLLMEYMEHKLNKKTKNKLEKSGKLGPLIGSILGIFPQCGFSASATNLYATRIISLGTLISVYLSTSDEMLPILLSEHADIKLIIIILAIKVLIGMISGFIIDYCLRNKQKEKHHDIKDFCTEEHCNCNHGIIISALKHTISIIIFIAIMSFFLNAGIYYLGEDNIASLLMKETKLGPLLSSVIGLIPNCAASVIITELYLENIITFGSLISGLLTGAGIGVLVLFKVNKNIKENIKIVLLIYSIGAISGIIIDLIGALI